MQKPVRSIHFLGICGTAMGAVAAALRDLGYSVSGSDDNVYPPMSTFLQSKGIEISGGYLPKNTPAEVDLVVVGNAICRGNPELESILNRKLFYRSLPETIKEFFLQGRTNIVVTGTHGKTTTTARPMRTTIPGAPAAGATFTATTGRLCKPHPMPSAT